MEKRDKAGTNVPGPTSWCQTEVEKWFVAHATAVNEGKPVRVETDLFQQGFDRSVPFGRATLSDGC